MVSIIANILEHANEELKKYQTDATLQDWKSFLGRLVKSAVDSSGEVADANRPVVAVSRACVMGHLDLVQFSVPERGTAMLLNLLTREVPQI